MIARLFLCFIFLFSSLQALQQFPLAKESPQDLFRAPLKRKLIVVDAGHGGNDFGTQSLGFPRYLEKTFTLITSFYLKYYLEQYGYTVAMTRQSDIFIPLDKRAEFANIRNADLFISIHYNSAPSRTAEGIEIFYYEKDENKQRVEQSKRLAERVLSHLIEETSANSRGVKKQNFAVIRETKMPAILIEGGFLTNESELEKLKQMHYLNQIAYGIAKGVFAYHKSSKT